MTELRSFRSGDIDEVVALWNRSAPRDPITRTRFRNVILLDPNFDAAGLRLAFSGGRLVGAAYAMRRLLPLHGDDLEPAAGWIGFFFVDPQHRRQGIGTAVLTDALTWLTGHGRSTVSFSPTTPNYVLPGLDADHYPGAAQLLRKVGFDVQYEAAAMDRQLYDYEIPADVRELIATREAEGYRFGSATDDDLVDLIPLARDDFNPDWGRAIREAVAAGMPLERILIVRTPTGRLVGWAMHGTYENVMDRFGPFGVLEECRGTGLGKALLHLTLERMRAQGAHSAWFLWTSEQSAAGFLYRKTGFATTRTFQIMRRAAST